MSLMPEHMGARGLELARELQVVVEGVLALVRVAQVARVADRRLAQLAGLEHRIDRDAHVLDPVERVEDAEQVDAACGGLRDEIAAPRCRGSWRSRRHWPRAAASAAAGSGSAARSCDEALPGVFLQEAHRHVEGRAAPALQREQLRQRDSRSRARSPCMSMRAHARREQRLMRVAHRRVGEQHALLRAASTWRSLPAPARRASAWCPAAARPVCPAAAAAPPAAPAARDRASRGCR